METTKLNSRLTVPFTIDDRHYTARFTHYVENPINMIFRVKLNTGEEFDAVANDYGWGADTRRYKPIAKALETHLDTLLSCYDYPHFSVTLPYKESETIFWIAEKGDNAYSIHFDGHYYCDVIRKDNTWHYSTKRVIDNKLDATLINRLIAVIKEQTLIAV
jgi:hypothetical protein